MYFSAFVICITYSIIAYVTDKPAVSLIIAQFDQNVVCQLKVEAIGNLNLKKKYKTYLTEEKLLERKI